MRPSSFIEHLAKHERAAVLAGLAGLSALSWGYLIWMARSMGSSASATIGLPVASPWTAGYALMTFVMWAIMMAGMMLPSVAPMILTFAAVHRSRGGRTGTIVPTWIFVAGYLAAWTLFSAVATALQWGLHSASLLASATLTVGPAIGGILLISAGAYQWTPLKARCLSRCTSPLDFLLTEWREGRRGAWIMGIKHGLFCVGCCAFIMVLLFVAGVMNLLWVAILAGLVLVEKLLPVGRGLGKAFGLASILSGAVLWAGLFPR